VSSIKGLGNDIIEIERIRKIISRFGPHFYKKIFTEKELEYCLKYRDPAIQLAGRFAAKEAIAKALGKGFGEHIAWLDIEILKDKEGKPIVSFSKTLNATFNSPLVHISISHCETFATAVAIWT